MPFATLPISELKKIVKHYKAIVNIPLSRNGRSLKKDEIIVEIEKHLEMLDDNRVRIKPHNDFLPNPAKRPARQPRQPRQPRKVAVQKPIAKPVKKQNIKMVIKEKPLQEEEEEEEEEEEQGNDVDIDELRTSTYEEIDPLIEELYAADTGEEKDEILEEILNLANEYENQTGERIPSRGKQDAIWYDFLKKPPRRQNRVVKKKVVKRVEKPVVKQVSVKLGKVKQPVSPDDKFYIYDDEGESGKENIKGIYNFKNVEVEEDLEVLYQKLGDQILIPWGYMQKRSGMSQFLKKIKENVASRLTLKRSIKGNDENDRIINAFIFNKKKMVGVVRATISKIGKTKDLHWDYVYVNQKFQGKGYAGELLNLLMAYINDNVGWKEISDVSLQYAADTPRGWIAYNKAINHYGYVNKKIEQKLNELRRNNMPLDGEKAINFVHNNIRGNQVWEYVRTGNGMLRKKILSDEIPDHLNTY